MSQALQAEMTNQSDKICVDVKYTFWQFYRFSLFVIFRTFRLILIPGALALLFFLVLLIYIALNPSPDNTFAQFLASSGSAPYVIPGLLFFLFGIPLYLAWKTSSNPRTREGTRYLFSENGIDIESSVGRSSLTWAAFGRALETRNMLLIFGQSGTAFAIPKRCFGCKEDVKATRQLLRTNIKKTKLMSK